MFKKTNLLHIQPQTFWNKLEHISFFHVYRTELKERCKASLQGGLDDTSDVFYQTLQNFHLNFKVSELLAC